MCVRDQEEVSTLGSNIASDQDGLSQRISVLEASGVEMRENLVGSWNGCV
jgi:hypothetical protein